MPWRGVSVAKSALRDNSARPPGAPADVDGRTVQSAHLFSRGGLDTCTPRRKEALALRRRACPSPLVPWCAGRAAAAEAVVDATTSNNNNAAAQRTRATPHSASRAPAKKGAACGQPACQQNLLENRVAFAPAQAGRQWRVLPRPARAGDRPTRGLPARLAADGGQYSSSLLALRAHQKARTHPPASIHAIRKRALRPAGVGRGGARVVACTCVPTPRVLRCILWHRAYVLPWCCCVPVQDYRRPHVAPRNVLMGATAR